jgi:hypothetical protein
MRRLRRGRSRGKSGPDRAQRALARWLSDFAKDREKKKSRREAA